jgi:hypothetical protein
MYTTYYEEELRKIRPSTVIMTHAFHAQEIQAQVFVLIFN